MTSRDRPPRARRGGARLAAAVAIGAAAWAPATGDTVPDEDPQPAVHELGEPPFRVAITTGTPVEAGSPLGLRFDHTAYVHAIELDGHQFLTDLGLVDEFGNLGTGVLGYDSAAPGDAFLKIGVGALERATSQAYQTSIRFPVRAAFAVRVTRDGDELRVSQRSDEVRGYAYQLDKTYRVRAGTRELEIAYALTNTGRKAFEFEHYNHNFLGFDDEPIDEQWVITLGYRLPSVPHSWLHQEHGQLRIEGTPGLRSLVQVNQPLSAEEAAVAIEHLAKRMRVRIAVDTPAYRTAYYFSPNSFSPEHFHRVVVAPGEVATWSIRYTFDVAAHDAAQEPTNP